jgi:2-hydroxycyclohexanecarboxyl-CoA dehydrogenase
MNDHSVKETGMTLKGKTAVVTGAASGIGRATAEALAAAGAHVLLGDIALEAGEAAAGAIRARGQGADFIRLDVTDPQSVAQFRDRALALRGHAEIVANVAGWGRTEPFVQNTPEFWKKVVDLNLMGPIQVSRAFIEPMIARNAGKIVTVASDAGRVGSLGETVYSAAKGGAIAFTKSLARELARYNITVNCVCPGPTDTPLMAAVPDKIREAFARVTPMRRLAKPSEIADAILFFSSPASDFVTGQVLSVSGGLTMAG